METKRVSLVYDCYEDAGYNNDMKDEVFSKKVREQDYACLYLCKCGKMVIIISWADGGAVIVV